VQIKIKKAVESQRYQSTQRPDRKEEPQRVMVDLHLLYLFSAFPQKEEKPAGERQKPEDPSLDQ
jgi:hypothetical protein